ncbi:MAG: adenylate/guanylate cyclase domain-containing protein [Acidimicrobiales bacterium]
MMAVSGTHVPPTEAADPSPVHRAFGFSDICGFTAYLEREGPLAAVRLVSAFRSSAREIAARRGVRVAKWLGDGVMFVSVEAGPQLATSVELTNRMATTGLHLRSGVATGSCLLMEADDYIGHSVNLAARLCDLAGPGEVLADENTATLAPDWVEVGPPRRERLPGVGKVEGICSLRLDADLPLLTA